MRAALNKSLKQTNIPLIYVSRLNGIDNNYYKWEVDYQTKDTDRLKLGSHEPG